MLQAPSGSQSAPGSQPILQLRGTGPVQLSMDHSLHVLTDVRYEGLAMSDKGSDREVTLQVRYMLSPFCMLLHLGVLLQDLLNGHGGVDSLMW